MKVASENLCRTFVSNLYDTGFQMRPLSLFSQANANYIRIRNNKMLFTEIIKDNKSFSHCYRSKYVSGPFAVCYYKRNRLPLNRMGITAGKKIGGAVERNRAKRIIRAAYRLCEKDFPIGYDIVFVARDRINGIKTQDIADFFTRKVIAEINRNELQRLRKK